LKALRDSAEAIAAFDVAVYMVSLDDAEKNRAFAEALKAKQVVLSDPGKKAAESYGVVGLRGLYARRWTFYIDASGKIRHIDKNVNVATAGLDIVRTLQTLGFSSAE
jgi:peroxiredoxin Q/BCP